MKRILVFISMLLCLTAGVYAQNGGNGCGDQNGPGGGGPCPGGNGNPPTVPPPTNHPGDEASPDGSASVDPNEIIGPTGYDSVRWVSINDMLNYTIYFENDPEFATANAQKVDVRFHFNSQAAMKGFGLGSFGFANRSFNIDEYPGAYQNRIDLRDSMHIYVDLLAAIDVVNQQAFWTFNSIDPETGVAPWQADRGMLPINDSTHVGEGFVTFRIKPQEDLHTGDTVSIVANIVFDQNDTIPTNRWTNKIDAGNPESKVTAELHPTLPNTYNLKFTGKDDVGGSGIKHVLLYLANHNGIYEETDTVAIDSVLAFPVEAGKQYKLYSIAVDNTGNREPAKEEPDVILNFNQAPTDIALSDTIFQDDLAAGGFIGRLTSIDSEDEKSFTYALAEGEGAIHNDLFQITDDQLQIKNSFKCAEDSIYKVRISTTDEGGMEFSKAFVLTLEKVLIKPLPDTLNVEICNGETFRFHGMEYTETGLYHYSESNDYMCDSLFVIYLTVRPSIEAPIVTTEGICTLVSSAEHTQWFREDGTPIEDATEQLFTPTEDGVYYAAIKSGDCYSEPSQAYRVVLTDNANLQLHLAKGWNWISSSLADENLQDAKNFLQPIAEVTNRFVSQNEELINDPVYGLTGGLSTINPKEGYKLHLSQNIEHLWSGVAVKPETTEITLHKGWNWIGYVPVMEHTINDALSTLTATENDIIKCLDDFAIYTGTSWIGTIGTMNPGEGYMYLANNPASFTYPVQRVFPVTLNSRRMPSPSTSAPWNYDANRYPDNTTLVGNLFNKQQQKMLEGTYTVGAFCNDECRGIGKYVNDMLFLTIHGTLNVDQVITFKAYENATGNEYSIMETVSFQGQQEGSYNSPFALHINETTGVETLDSQNYVIYPRPLRSRLFVNGETENIKSIKVLATDGTVCVSVTGYPAEGIDVSSIPSGIYVVAIVPTKGDIYYEKVFKAQNK